MKAATQVWLAFALLHHERGVEADFDCADIQARIAREPWAGGVTAETIATHVSGHCVASGRPSPDRDRMLTRTSRGRYRLFRPGDTVHPQRASGRLLPDPGDVPQDLAYLLRWYEESYAGDGRERAMEEFVRLMKDSGSWRGVNADDYVRSLREGWA